MSFHSGGLNLAGWFHLVYFGFVIPGLVVYRRNALFTEGQPLPNRLRHFRVTAFALLAFASISLLVAWVQRIPLFPRSLPPPTAVIAGIVFYAVAVLHGRRRWRSAVERRAPAVYLFMPVNARERGWWIAVSLLAGVGEEITSRGVQAAVVGMATGNFWVTVLLCSISFGLAHAIQGWKTVAIISVFTVGLHALVWLAGSLYVAMIVHVAYDITAGISYGRLGKELMPDGFKPAPNTATSAEPQPCVIICE
jgi:hypothetical protein